MLSLLCGINKYIGKDAEGIAADLIDNTSVSLPEQNIDKKDPKSDKTLAEELQEGGYCRRSDWSLSIHFTISQILSNLVSLLKLKKKPTI